MLDIANTKKNRKMINSAAEYHRELTQKTVKWTKTKLIFPRKCCLTGKSTGWFATVWKKEISCKLWEIRPSHMHKKKTVEYASDLAYSFAILNNNPKLDK